MRGGRILAGGTLAAVLATAGCGGDSMTEVSGQVTFDDKPVESGAITFVPVDGATPTAGGTITAGKYNARVPVGKMKVSISAPKVVGTKKIYPTENSPEMPITVEALPARYNEKTELQFEVNSGPNEKSWQLKSK